MHKEIIIINTIIFLYILQRMSEIFISKNNEKWLERYLDASEVAKKQSLTIKIFHTIWFISLIIESNARGSLHSHPLFIYIVLFGSQLIRFHSIKTLKHFWTIKLFKTNPHNIIHAGLYRYIKHPNYLAVILEFIFVPLLLQSYFTLFFFSLINLIIIMKRIQTEEDILMSQSNYKETFKVHRRFIPYIFILIFFSNILWAKDVQILYPNYDQAKKATPFIKFSSTSTKLGFITTDFDGFAKKFKYSYELDGNILKSIIITIDATSFDTDSDGRNEKMNSEILNSKDFTQILAKLKMPVTLSEGSFTTDGSFTIKNIELIKPIKYEVKKIDNKFIIKGHAKIGLKEAQLPDPSIAIAKVRDDFDLDFEIEL